jgi:predicted nucleotidyltransferase
MRREPLEGVELERCLVALTRALVDAFAPERVILFGSFARGDQNLASDFDVVVIARTSLPFCDRIGRALAACSDASVGVPVEALVYTPGEWERMEAAGNVFAELVRQEGRVLHGSKPERGAAVAEAGAS